MELRMPWGDGELDVRIPDTWNLLDVRAAGQPVGKRKSALDLVGQAIDRPLLSEPLARYVTPETRILLVVDDDTRPTPTAQFLGLLLDIIARKAGSLDGVTLVPALGIHTPMSEEAMARKVGQENLRRIRWENHDPFDEGKHINFGTTRRGTRVLLNRLVGESDLIIIVGMVEPHLWAGFGGGLKNILPGLAHASTIGMHHGILAEKPYRLSRVGMPPGENSFRLDLEEIRTMIEARIFCLNVVLDRERRVAAAFAGDPVACHREAVNYNDRISGRIISERADAVIVNSAPMDINFKQSMKSVGNAVPALRPGGTVIGFLRAERGADDLVVPEDSKPLWLVKGILRALGPSRVLWFLEHSRPGLNVEEKFLLYYSMQLTRAHNLYLYVPTLTAEEARRFGFFVHALDPQEIVDRARRKIGRRANVAFFPEAGATYPVVERR